MRTGSAVLSSKQGDDGGRRKKERREGIILAGPDLPKHAGRPLSLWNFLTSGRE